MPETANSALIPFPNLSDGKTVLHLKFQISNSSPSLSLLDFGRKKVTLNEVMRALPVPCFILHHSYFILVIFLLSACSDPVPPDLAALQKSREALQIENSQLKEKAEADARRIRTLEEDLRVKTKDWAERSTKISEESRARLESLEQLKAENLQLQADLAAFRRVQAVEARTEAKGSQIPLLKTRDGETYKNVTIRSVVPDGLHIIHQTGATKILFTQLDPSWGDRFGYNTKEAEAYAADQSRQRAAAQKAQWEALQAQQTQEEEKLADSKRSAAKRKGKEEAPQARELANLRAALLAELQSVAAGMKGNLSISRADPENSQCFNNNLITLRLSRARDLRAQINNLKNQNGAF